MNIKGQPTRLAGRIETGERWQAGQSDAHIAQALQRPNTFRQADPRNHF